MSLIAALEKIEPKTIAGQSIVFGVRTGMIDATARMIFDMSCDNLKGTLEVVGQECLDEVINYLTQESC